MNAMIRKFGNSVGLIIPKPMREALNLHAGQNVTLELAGEGLLMKPVRKKYNLADLLAENDHHGEAPEDMIAWQNMQAVGKEIL